MSDDPSKLLESGEAKIGRFLLRMALAVAWGVAAYIVFTRAESLDISYTMKIILAGFATVMAIVSFVQALGNYGPDQKQNDVSGKSDADTQTKDEK
ncbi:hypothetical protein [Hirschia litorea]|uniref:Uncharacterized protein n=1 Tax=Hirschia litorea TaxID=1199156 RepID=A0ABW2IM12_9PROT